MDKYELIKIAEYLHQEAFYANCYFEIIQQYYNVRKEYEQEYQLSPAFYNFVLTALQKACLIDVAKLYDKSLNTINIGSLINLCKENLDLFPEYQEQSEIAICGVKHSFNIPYQHYLKPEEECFFMEIVERHKQEIKFWEEFGDTDIFGELSSDFYKTKVELKFSDFLDLYNKRFCSLSKKQEKIRVQRNKIYVHNDKTTILDTDSVLKENSIASLDIKEMIEFALDVTILVLNILTGEIIPRGIKNMDDWDNTLYFANLGLKHQKEYLEKNNVKES